MYPSSAHALVIGITQYQHIPPLPRVADAEDVAGVLCDPAACCYRAANVTLLRETEASRARIIDALDELVRRTGTDSTAVVYFSGHGGRSVSGGDSYLIPVDGRWGSPNELEDSAISSRVFGAKLAAIGAARLLVVLDCCHAADLANAKDVQPPTWAPDLTDDALGQLARGRGRIVMAASRGDGAAYVMSGARNGLFTEHLLAGLRGAAGRGDGFIYVQDLYDHVQRNVVARNPAQRPVMKAEIEDNFVVALCKAAPALAAPQPSELAYDALVVAATHERDQSWAISTVVRRLEESGLRVCVETRDAELGRARIREIERMVATSRYTLPVLTPRFSAGGFEELQSMMALHLGVMQGQARLIPIVREPCEASLAVQMLVHLDMIRDENVAPGIDRLVQTLRTRT